MSQLSNRVLALKIVQEACSSIMQEVPRGVENPNYDHIHGMILEFVRYIVDLADKAEPPHLKSGDIVGRLNFLAALAEEDEDAIDEQVKCICEKLSLFGVRYISIMMKQLANVVMIQTLHLRI